MCPLYNSFVMGHSFSYDPDFQILPLFFDYSISLQFTSVIPPLTKIWTELKLHSFPIDFFTASLKKKLLN